MKKTFKVGQTQRHKKSKVFSKDLQILY